MLSQQFLMKGLLHFTMKPMIFDLNFNCLNTLSNSRYYCTFSSCFSEHSQIVNGSECDLALRFFSRNVMDQHTQNLIVRVDYQNNCINIQEFVRYSYPDAYRFSFN